MVKGNQCKVEEELQREKEEDKVFVGPKGFWSERRCYKGPGLCDPLSLCSFSSTSSNY